MTEQMIKLRQMLTEKGIEYVDHSDPEGYKLHIDRTHFMIETPKTHFFSVVHGVATYGGINLYGNDRGYLECQIDHKEPKGWLTAEDVMKLIDEVKEEDEKNGKI